GFDEPTEVKDYTQQIIEIVRHTAGKLAETLHPLGLMPLLQQFLLLGDVLRHDVASRAVSERQLVGGDLDLDHGAVLEAMSRWSRRVDVLHAGNALWRLLKVVGQKEFLDGHREELVLRVAVLADAGVFGFQKGG